MNELLNRGLVSAIMARCPERMGLVKRPVGKDDFVLKSMTETEKVLQSHKIKHTYRITEGNHSWPVWRRSS